MISRELEARKNHKNYYQKNLKSVTNLLFVCTLVMLILIVVILYKFFTLPEPYYYSTSTAGQLFELTPVPKGTGLVARDQN